MENTYKSHSFHFCIKTGTKNKNTILQTFNGVLESYNFILFIRGSSRPQFSRQRPVRFEKIGSFPGSCSFLKAQHKGFPDKLFSFASTQLSSILLAN
jgi:hypothetical protein